MAINFFVEDIDFNLIKKRLVKVWIKELLKAEGFKVGNLNFIFTSDEYLLQINQSYLKHDYFTDIITFADTENEIAGGDIYISIDRVKENSSNNSIVFFDELKRILAHGCLHSIGYEDKNEEEKKIMTSKEDFYLNLFDTLISQLKIIKE